MLPALEALKAADPEGLLHVAVWEEAAPLIERHPAVDKVWPIPRKAGWLAMLKIMRAMRDEHFDRSIDFVGNDRGALLSRFVNATERIGVVPPLGFAGRRRCYHSTRPDPGAGLHQIERDLDLLTLWNIPPNTLEPRIYPDPALAGTAATMLPPNGVILHLSTSQPKKEWPSAYWSRVGDALEERGLPAFFAAGPGPREQALIDALLDHRPYSRRLPPTPDLALYLSILARARLFVSCDTGPLHMAAALGVTTISLFGPSPAWQWQPRASGHVVLVAKSCTCSPHARVCTSDPACMAMLPPERVVDELLVMLMRQYTR